MSSQAKEGSASSDQTPNFELPRHDVIHEDNWLEYEAQGFRHVRNTPADSPLDLDLTQAIYGVAHIYTGSAFDERASRPLRHKPGVGIYVDPEGLAIGMEKKRKWAEDKRKREEHQRGSGGGPASS